MKFVDKEEQWKRVLEEYSKEELMEAAFKISQMLMAEIDRLLEENETLKCELRDLGYHIE